MKTKVRSTFDAGLYERCINLAIKLSEQQPNYTQTHGYLGYVQKYNPDEVLKLSDKLYAKIKGEK